MKHIFDMIIIGGGPAGYTAALYAARAGLDTLIIERMSAGGQMALTGEIENYPGFENGIDGFTLGTKMQSGAERFGAKTEYAEVEGVRLDSRVKEIITSSGSLFSRTVVIATGANPRLLGVAGEESLVGRGVHYCAHCDGRFYKDKTVAVVGGGNSAVGDALYLSRLAKKVYLIHRRDSLRADRILREQILLTENVEVIWNSEISELISDGRISAVKVKNNITADDTWLPVDGLFIAIGRRPATDMLAGQLNLDDLGYIIADETTKTNIDGVYAVGDVRTKPLRQIVTAVADGATAVHFAEEYLSLLNSD